MGAHYVPRDSPNLSGCPGLLPGSASAHARIVDGERRDATCRGGGSQAPGIGALLALAAASIAARANARARAESSRRGAPDQPHRCPLAVSQPLRCRIFLTPGVWA